MPDDVGRLVQVFECLDDHCLRGNGIAVPTPAIAVVAPINTHLIGLEGRLAYYLGYCYSPVTLVEADEGKHLQRLLHQSSLCSLVLHQQCFVVLIGGAWSIAKRNLREHAAGIQVVERVAVKRLGLALHAAEGVVIVGIKEVDTMLNQGVQGVVLSNVEAVHGLQFAQSLDDEECGVAVAVESVHPCPATISVLIGGKATQQALA